MTRKPSDTSDRTQATTQPAQPFGPPPMPVRFPLTDVDLDSLEDDGVITSARWAVGEG